MRHLGRSTICLAWWSLALSACGLDLVLGYPAEPVDAGADAYEAPKDATSPRPDGASDAKDATLEVSDAGHDAQSDETSSPDADAGIPQRRVFVTTDTYTGAEIGSLAAADTLCKNIAANLKGTWHALLGEDETYAEIITRIGARNVPIVRTDGEPVVADITKLLTASPALSNPINLDHAAFPVGGFVWTGISAGASKTGKSSNNCVKWASGAPGKDGLYGQAAKVTEEFLMRGGGGTDTCNTKHSLYCIEE